MSSHNSHYFCRAVSWLALFASLAGCSGQSTVESFHPAQDRAREALETALTAWQNGQEKPGRIETAEPAVQVTDAAWDAGSKLKSFEISDLPGDSPRKFSVKLSLEGAATPQEITYVVVGKDPLWVMREDQYNRNSEM
jgi:hypothetical protein